MCKDLSRAFVMCAQHMSSTVKLTPTVNMSINAARV